MSLGVARGGELAWRTQSLDKADGGPRRLAGAHRDLWAFFAAAAKEFPPVRVAVEQPFAGPNMVHPGSQWMLGVVLAVLGGVVPTGVPIVLLPVPKWKLAATGRGIAARETVLEQPCPDCAAVPGVMCDAKRPHSKRLRKAEKQRLITWARSRGYDGLLSDEADALGVAVACQVLSGAEALLSAQGRLPIG